MNKPDQIQLVKAQLARKAMEAKKHKLSPPQNLSPKKATAKPAKNPAFFDPDLRGNWLV